VEKIERLICAIPMLVCEDSPGAVKKAVEDAMELLKGFR